MAGIKHVTVNRYNYMAHLPDDFQSILSVYRSGEIYVDSNFIAALRFKPYPIPNGIEVYFVQDRIGDVGLWDISFSGAYSRYWIIRIFQKLADLYWPVKYRITYYSKDPTYRIYKDSEGQCTLLGEIYMDVSKEEYDKWTDKKEVIYL